MKLLQEFGSDPPGISSPPQTELRHRLMLFVFILSLLTTTQIFAQESNVETPAEKAANNAEDVKETPDETGKNSGAQAPPAVKTKKAKIREASNAAQSKGLISVVTQPLRIIYTGASLRDLTDTASLKDQERQFTKMCENVGKALQMGMGPWGQGAFAEIECDQTRTIEPNEDSKIDWVLEIKPVENKMILFRLQRLKPDVTKGNAIQPTVYNEIKLPEHPKFMAAFANVELADFLAHALLNSMPISLFVPSYTIADNASVDFKQKIYRGRAWRSDSRFIQPAPFESMRLFRVFFSPKKNAYQAKLAGDMKFNGFESKPVPGSKDVMALSPVWSLSESALSTLKKSGQLWARRAKASKRGQERLNRLVVRIYRYLTEGDKKFVKGLLVRPDEADDQNLLDRVKNLDVELPGGYAGFRYGLSIATKDELLAESSVFGLLVSVKTGWLDGFSLFVDISPRVIYNDPFGNQETIDWQRTVLGYGFDFEIYDFRFDLTPKIGQWSFNAQLVPEGLDPEEGTWGLNLNNALAVGYELGVELLVPLVSARAWVGQDGAISIANKYAGSSVRSLRGGIDAFYTVGELFSVGARELGLALLGFTFFDYITMTNNKDSLYDEAGEIIGLQELSYPSSFIGGGVSISW